MRTTWLRALIAGASLAWLAIPTLASASEVRKITLKANKYDWIPASIQVKVGQTVELTLVSLDVPHAIASQQLGIPSTHFKKNQPAKVTFTPTETGTFRFKCSKYCGSGHKKMVGQIVVVP